MPRISRSVVEFAVDGVVYLAKFSHSHENGKPLVSFNGNKAVRLTHITRCELTQKDDTLLSRRGIGSARCSKKEQYKWQRGVKMAFQRALVDRGIAKETRGENSYPIFKGVDDRYNKFMFNFFTEMRYRPEVKSASSCQCSCGKCCHPDRKKESLLVIDAQILPETPVVEDGKISAAAVDPRSYTGLTHGYGWTGD